MPMTLWRLQHGKKHWPRWSRNKGRKRREYLPPMYMYHYLRERARLLSEQRVAARMAGLEHVWLTEQRSDQS